MVALAVICRPRLLLADEPTTALDVTVQAQILRLMVRLRDQTGTAILLVTHNLGVIAQVCDRVSVMYAGRIVESAPTQQIFRSPEHPYTRGLLHSVPRLRPADGAPHRLEPIHGTVPSPHAMPPGCPFHPRCRHARAVCAEQAPPLGRAEPGHQVRCHFAGELGEDGG
jgi:oligopeptide/dipeptide ABC transporter ATP-binding protein